MNKFAVLLLSLSFLILIGVAFYITKPLKILEDKNDQTRVSDLRNIAAALEGYYRDNGHYPHTDSDYEIVTQDGTHHWGYSWMPYIKSLPKDPGVMTRYVYWSDPINNYQSFKLYASLGDPTKISDSCKTGNECGGVPAPNLCGGSNPCNFGITSSNISP